MALTRRGRQPKTSDTPIKFKPYKTDFTVIDSLARAQSVERPQIARMLISEAIRNRNLKAVGKDETMDVVVAAQKKAMAEVLAPLVERVEALSQDIRRVEGRMSDEFSQAEKRQNFIVQAARFIVFEIIIVRMLVRDYVHTAYVKFVESVGRPVKDVEANFSSRVEKYKAEAGAILDDLAESSLGELHTLADSKSGFLQE